MPLREWVDVAFVKICVRHTSATIAAMASFKSTAVVADAVLEDERLRLIVHGFEQIGLVLCLVWLVHALGVLLWRHRVGRREGT